MNMASVARRNGAPGIAPTPISLLELGSPPTTKAPKMATIRIMVSGTAVPTAASTLPTAPYPQPNLSSSISL